MSFGDKLKARAEQRAIDSSEPGITPMPSLSPHRAAIGLLYLLKEGMGEEGMGEQELAEDWIEFSKDFREYLRMAELALAEGAKVPEPNLPASMLLRGRIIAVDVYEMLDKLNGIDVDRPPYLVG